MFFLLIGLINKRPLEWCRMAEKLNKTRSHAKYSFIESVFNWSFHRMITSKAFVYANDEF